MKPCPFCGEQIQPSAVKCRYCGEWLDPSARPAWSVPEAPAAEVLAREVARQLAALGGAAAPPALGSGGAHHGADGAALPGEPDPDPRPAQHDLAPPLGAPAPRTATWSAAGLPDDDDDDPDPPIDLRTRGQVSAVEAPARPDPEPTPAAPSAWDPPAWIAGGTPGASAPGGPSPTAPAAAPVSLAPQPAAAARPQAPEAAAPEAAAPIPGQAERQGLAEVANRMQRLKQAAEVVRRDVQAREAARASQAAQPSAGPPIAAATPQARHHEPHPAAPSAAAPSVIVAATPRPTAPIAPPVAAPSPDPTPARAADERPPVDDELADAPSGAAADFTSSFLGDLDDDDDDDDGDDLDLGGLEGGRARFPLWLGAVLGVVVVAAAGVAIAFGSGWIGGERSADASAAEADPDAVKESAVVDAEAAGGDAPTPEAEVPLVAGDTEDAGAGDTGTGGAPSDAEAEAAPPSPELQAAFDAKVEEARAAYKSGKLTQAVPLAEEALAMIPEHPQALALLANARLEQGKIEEAKAAADTCVQKSPETADCWLTVAVLAETENDGERALTAWQAYLEHAPEGRYANNAKKAIKRLAK